MADNVVVTEGAGTNIAADEVVDGTLGTVKVQYTKLMDGTLNGTAKSKILAANTAPVAADPALVVAISPNGQNINGQSTMAASSPVAIASDQSTIPVSQVTLAYDIQSTVTRSANTLPYSANDVVGGAINLGSLGPSGGSILITSVQMQYNVNAIPSGMTTFTLHIYNVTPPSAFIDNVAFDLPSGDRASFLGSISIPAPLDYGATLYSEVNSVNKQVKLAGTNLFGYLVTAGAYTPAANSETINITMHTVSV